MKLDELELGDRAAVRLPHQNLQQDFTNLNALLILKCNAVPNTLQLPSLSIYRRTATARAIPSNTASTAAAGSNARNIFYGSASYANK